jgi:DNA repair protein RadD
MITLRGYQEAAKAAVYEHLRSRDDNPCVVVPTAGGKSPLMASICKDAVGTWSGRVLILAHVRELLEQTAEKLRAVCPEVQFGIYSAGLKRRDTSQCVILAGIQSVYQRACELGPFDLVLVDEAHLIPLEGDGMYRQFLADAKVVNPIVRIVGFTATAFRLKSGPICTPDGVLNHICYEVGVRELIRDGFLCPLVTKSGIKKPSFTRLHIRGGEFMANEVEDLMDHKRLVKSACREIIGYTNNRQAVLIFASGVRHARHIVGILAKQYGIECGLVTGGTPPQQRDAILDRFRRGELKYLCNVNVLTTGFDAPHIDCVALLRPTLSPGLYYQMVGRGFRLHPGKQDCLVLDFGGNVMRHGPVDELRIKPQQTGGGEAPAKECPECRSVVATGYACCPSCGHEFPPRERKTHEAQASEAAILSKQVKETKYTVTEIVCRVHCKRGALPDAPKTLRVGYRVGFNHWQYEFICFEHQGYARQKAVAWWRQRSNTEVPDTAESALEIIEAGGLAYTEQITVRSVAGEQYSSIVAYKLAPPDAENGRRIGCLRHQEPVLFTIPSTTDA